MFSIVYLCRLVQRPFLNLIQSIEETEITDYGLREYGLRITGLWMNIGDGL